MSEIQRMSTVLCVESADSGFAATNAILDSGAFRVVAATNSEAALRAFAALRVGAVVFDFRTLLPHGIRAAKRMREIVPTVPHVLVCPSTEVKEPTLPG